MKSCALTRIDWAQITRNGAGAFDRRFFNCARFNHRNFSHKRGVECRVLKMRSKNTQKTDAQQFNQDDENLPNFDVVPQKCPSIVYNSRCDEGV